MRSNPDRSPGKRTPGIPIGPIVVEDAPAPVAHIQGDTTVYGSGLNEGVFSVPIDAPRPAPPRPKPRVDLDKFLGKAEADPDSAYLARAWQRGGAGVADGIRKSLAEIEPQIESAPGYPVWGHVVRHMVDRRQKLNALLSYFDSQSSGEAAAYKAPDPADADSESGRIIMELALRRTDTPLGILLLKVGQGLAKHITDAEATCQQIDTLVSAGTPILDSLAKHRALVEKLAAASRLISDSHRLIEGFPPAFAAVVSSILDEYGGVAEVAAGLDEAKQLEAGNGPPHDPASAELTAIEAKLKSLGASPDSLSPGRIAAQLQSRHGELTAIVEANRSAYRQRLASQALATVVSAAAGDYDAWEVLKKAATATPGAFLDGFPAALAQAPLEALKALPTSPLAYILI